MAPSCAVRAEAVGGDVMISVTDEGVGIPLEDLPHVFDSFFRVRRGDRTAPGTGARAGDARGLVEAMGGRIDAQSPSPDAPRDRVSGLGCYRSAAGGGDMSSQVRPGALPLHQAGAVGPRPHFIFVPSLIPTASSIGWSVSLIYCPL
ncbi:MAG: ATP-binding protein [Rhodospirillales bacterium]